MSETSKENFSNHLPEEGAAEKENHHEEVSSDDTVPNEVVIDETTSSPKGLQFESYFDRLIPELGRENVDKQIIERCFDHFKSPVDHGLNYSSFVKLLNELFVDQVCKRTFYIPQIYYQELFRKFDKDHDNIIDQKEFTQMWHKWIQIILKPKCAFIVVDVQNDFISGSLAIFRCPAGHKGEEVVPVINRLLESVEFDLIVYSYDWHPLDHISFIENYRKRKIILRNGLPLDKDEGQIDDLQLFEEVTFAGPPQTDQKMWPKHCVQDSWGAKLHPDLKITGNYINIFKGTNPNIDSYSAFWDNNKLSETGLGKELKDRGITDVFICGIAYDVCVGATAEHANEYGFRTTLVNDATRGVDTKAISQTKNRLINKSAVVVDSDRVKSMVIGLERRPEHAYHLATFIK